MIHDYDLEVKSPRLVRKFENLSVMEIDPQNGSLFADDSYLLLRKELGMDFGEMRMKMFLGLEEKFYGDFFKGKNYKGKNCKGKMFKGKNCKGKMFKGKIGGDGFEKLGEVFKGEVGLKEGNEKVLECRGWIGVDGVVLRLEDDKIGKC